MSERVVIDLHLAAIALAADDVVRQRAAHRLAVITGRGNARSLRLAELADDDLARRTSDESEAAAA